MSVRTQMRLKKYTAKIRAKRFFNHLHLVPHVGLRNYWELITELDICPNVVEKAIIALELEPEQFVTYYGREGGEFGAVDFSKEAMIRSWPYRTSDGEWCVKVAVFSVKRTASGPFGSTHEPEMTPYKEARLETWKLRDVGLMAYMPPSGKLGPYTRYGFFVVPKLSPRTTPQRIREWLTQPHTSRMRPNVRFSASKPL